MTGEIMNKHQLAETQRRIREDNTFWQARVNELKDEVAALRNVLRDYTASDGHNGVWDAQLFRKAKEAARQALGDNPHD